MEGKWNEFERNSDAKIGRQNRMSDEKIRQRRVDPGRGRRFETRGGYLQREELEEDW